MPSTCRTSDCVGHNRQDEPIFFVRVIRIEDDTTERVRECSGRLLEGHAMLPTVSGGLRWIPFELNPISQCVASLAGVQGSWGQRLSPGIEVGTAGLPAARSRIPACGFPAPGSSGLLASCRSCVTPAKPAEAVPGVRRSSVRCSPRRGLHVLFGLSCLHMFPSRITQSRHPLRHANGPTVPDYHGMIRLPSGPSHGSPCG